MSKILDYKRWGAVNEGLFWDVIEREPIDGTTHKVKVKYVDANNIKIKAVNDYDMVKQDGTVDPNLPEAIVDFLKKHDGTDFARTYPQLQDITAFYKDNFFTYNVKKETDNRQVVIFSLQKRADFKNVGADVKVLSDAQATQQAQTPAAKTILKASDTSLSQNTAAVIPKPGQVKLAQPVIIDNLGMLGANDPLFKLVDDIVAGLSVANPFTDAKAKEVLSKAADELEGKDIGDNTILLIKGLMAGLGIAQYTNKYGKVQNRTQITQTVADKLATLIAEPAVTTQNSSRNFYLGLDGNLIFEQEDESIAAKATLPSDFKMAEFLKAIGGGATAAQTTGDIKVPDGGFVKGKVTAGDAELKKVQQLIIDKFAKKLANSPTYKKFAGYQADGKYGPTTERIIAGLKAGFGLSDKSGTTITSELINKIQTEKIDESYLTLAGSVFEAFDVDAYTNAIKSYSPAATTAASSETTASKSAAGGPAAGFNVDAVAKKMWEAIAKESTEDEDKVYEVFEKDIKTKEQLQKFLDYWKGLKFARKSGHWYPGKWEEVKKKYAKEEAGKPEYELKYWLDDLLDLPAERERVNAAVSKYSSSWKLKQTSTVSAFKPSVKK